MRALKLRNLSSSPSFCTSDKQGKLGNWRDQKRPRYFIHEQLNFIFFFFFIYGWSNKQQTLIDNRIDSNVNKNSNVKKKSLTWDLRKSNKADPWRIKEGRYHLFNSYMIQMNGYFTSDLTVIFRTGQQVLGSFFFFFL